MISLSTFLSAATKIAQAGLAEAPEVLSLVQGAVAALHPQDQDAAKAALADLEANNDEGFARLDAKLAEAEQR